jgi:hypothetical protein
MENKELLSMMKKELEKQDMKSAWSRGVSRYAGELMDELGETIEYNTDAFCNRNLLEKAMLNGADSWSQYSYGGCSLVYDGDIAERLCAPSEFKKKRGGELPPNAREQWLDVQARALNQACNRVTRLYTHIMQEGKQ